MTAWLAFHQSADGRYSSTAYVEACGGTPCSGAAEHDDAGTTGLALLALFSHGDFPDPPYSGPHVTDALEWLLARQDDDGWLAGGREDLLSHALATLAFVVVALPAAASPSSGPTRNVHSSLKA